MKYSWKDYKERNRHKKRIKRSENQSCSLLHVPEGSRGCLMSSTCFKSQGCHFIPLYYLLSCSSAYSHCSFCLLSFSAYWPIPLTFFQKILQYLKLTDKPFGMAFVQKLGDDSWSVVSAACWHVALIFASFFIFYLLVSFYFVFRFVCFCCLFVCFLLLLSIPFFFFFRIWCWS